MNFKSLCNTVNYRGFFILGKNWGKNSFGFITRLPSDFRRFLTYRGEQLVEIDIVNSQPYFSTLLLDPEFYDTSSKRYATIKKKINNPTKNYKSTADKHKHKHRQAQAQTPPPTLTMVKMMELSKREDVMEYMDIVGDGRLYEHASELLERDGTGKVTRGAAKEIMFQVLFTSNKFIGQVEAGPKRLFRKEFPTVYDTLSAYKRDEKEYLSILLQRIEAYVILDIVCKEISKAYPSVPLFTIHDSVITTESNAGLVWDHLVHYCKQAIGIEPKLRYKYWDYSQL